MGHEWWTPIAIIASALTVPPIAGVTLIALYAMRNADPPDRIKIIRALASWLPWNQS